MTLRLTRALVLTASLFFAAARSMAFMPPERPSLPDFDKRAVGSPRVSEPAGEQQAAAARLRARLPSARVDFDSVTGGPKMISAGAAFLTGPNGAGKAVSAATAAGVASDDPHRPVKSFLSEHAAVFGFGPDALGKANIRREFKAPHSGLHTVVWEQQVDGLPVFGAVFIAHTTRQGELVNVASQFVPDPDAAAARGVTNRAALLAAPPIRAARALSLAVGNIGQDLDEQKIVVVAPADDTGATGPGKHQQFTAPGLKGKAEAGLLWLPMSKDKLRLCWDVIFMSRPRGEMFRVLVDVETGEPLLRRCLTAYLTPATYNVYTSDSPSPFSPGYPTPQTSQPPLVPRTLVTLSALDTNASPAGWIPDDGNQTLGNNVDAHTDWNADDSPDLPRPQGSPSRVFNFPMDLGTQDPTNYASAAVAQLFYLNNWMHDKLYELGFNEAAGNFQSNNFGRGGLGNDAVQADAQDGGGTDNANFSTPPDGYAGRMQMYLFTGPSPRRDGDLDAEIVLHEYTHGLSNRRVGGGAGISQLQSAGMGEGWSDFYALSLLSEAGDDVNGVYAAAGYASYRIGGATDLQNYYFGIRRYPYSTDMTKNPLTFKDIDPAQADYCASGASYHTGMFGSCSTTSANEVHNQGEVWCVTLWEARARLINKYGWAAGNQLILQLVTDGMNLSPVDPNFVQARDAILQADLVDNAGANQNELWAAFAKRGLGFTATSPASSTTAGVHEAFDLPDDLRIAPVSGFVSSGPVGGPFNVTSQLYSLTNAGSNVLSWTLANTSTWLSASPASGTLSPSGPAAAVNVSLAAANSLTAGIYNATVWFTNRNDGVGLSRAFTLRVGQPDFFTEMFDGSTSFNDLAYSTITFTPNGSSSYYSACHDAATAFPTSPTGGTNISLTDDSFAQVTLTGTNSVTLYGRRTNVFFIGSNGYITLTSGDTSFVPTYSTHFAWPRIAPLFRDLNPGAGSTISWRQFSDRVAVTYQNVPNYGTTLANSFQVEMFVDGRIRLTWLALGTQDGLVGLSQGLGLPTGFQASDLSTYSSCSPLLFLAAPPTATEGDGVLTGAGQVFLSAPLTTNVTVTLTSSNTAAVVVPGSVVIPAGGTNAAFNITIIDDSILNGTRTSLLTASASGFITARTNMTVYDSDTATLQVILPATLVEGGSVTQGTVRVNAPVGANVSVNLASSDPGHLVVPAIVVIPNGQTSAVFAVSLPDDGLINGAQTVSLVAFVQNWTHGYAEVTVLEKSDVNLRLTLPAAATEGIGVLLNAGVVRLSAALPTNLVVSLVSSNLNELSVPPTVFVAAGLSAAAFNVSVLHNPLVTGDQTAAVRATASGFTDGNAAMVIHDYETPLVPANPSPADLATNVPANTALSWSGSAGDATNDVYFGTNSNPGTAELVGSTTNAAWTLPLLAPNTTYYWKIVSHRVGITSGPVWQFTTRGINHFAWSDIATPQFKDRPFPVIITAQDELGQTVASFSGPVALAVSLVGTPLFSADFENGSISDWASNGGSYVRAVTNSTAAGGTNCLTLIGGSGTHYNGISHPLSNITPDMVSFYVRGNANNLSEGYFALGTGPRFSSNVVFFLLGPTGMGIMDSGAVGHYVPYAAYQWYKITLYLNWAARTVDYYVNDVLAAANVTFCSASVSSLSAVYLYNYSNAQVWYDELIFSTGSSLARLALSPTNSDSFSSGVWAGNLTVQTLGDAVRLSADDGQGHSGISTNFTVLATNDLILSLTSAPNPTFTGGSWTNLIVLTNTGPGAATGVMVTNPLPLGATIATASASQGNFSLVGGAVVFDAGTLNGGSTATFTVILTPTLAGTLTNTAMVSRLEPDPVPANNFAQTSTLVLPVLSVEDGAVVEGDIGTTNLFFTLRLSAPSLNPVSVAYATTNGTATAGADYLPTNGVVVFSPGATMLQVAVPVIGDVLVEPNEAFYLQLSNSTNAVLGRSQATGTILDDDAIPGRLHHFVWSATPSPQVAGVPFGISLLAVDSFGNLATNVGVSVSITAATAGSGEVFRVDFENGLQGFAIDNTASGSNGLWHVSTGRALDAGHSASNSLYDGHNETLSGGGNYDNGLRNGGTVTSPAISLPPGQSPLGLSFNYLMEVEDATNWDQAMVELSTNNGASYLPIAGKNQFGGLVSDTGGLWVSNTINLPPVTSSAIRLRFRFDTIDSSANGTEGWYLDDIAVRSLGGAGSIAMAPASIGPFVQGVATGWLSISNPATDLVLIANDGKGHTGANSPFSVLVNDISVAMSASANPAYVGYELTFPITVANSGPGAATGVVVTNYLPLGLNFVTATTSQGTWIQDGSRIICNLGTLPAAGTAAINIVATPTAAVVIKNVAIVSRFETDAVPANNTAEAAVTVTWPPTATNFMSAAAIVIPTFGQGVPYPATNRVGGLDGVIAKVKVTIGNFAHLWPADISLLLADPAGQTVMLMNHAGGSYAITNVTLTFDDEAGLLLPESAPITPGAYKPTSFDPVPLLPPAAPAQPFGAALSAFNDSNPNGTWKLFAYDSSMGDGGVILNGWGLTIYTAPFPRLLLQPARLASGSLQLSFDTLPGYTYTIEYKDALNAATWLPWQTVPGDGTSKTLTQTNLDAAARFYRLQAK